MHTRQILGAAALCLAFGTVAGAQTSAQASAKMTAGDKALAARDAKAAMADYEAAVAADPKDARALSFAAHTAVILGEFSPPETRDSLYSVAEKYARRAVDADTTAALAHFALAEVLGRISQTIANPMSKLPYSREVYSNVKSCLKLDPKNAECNHIYGEWNAEVMRVPAGLRSMGISFMGATELGEASWDKAVQYLSQAVTLEPKRAAHHLDLGRTYADMNETAKAKAEFQAVIQAPTLDYNDPHYKEQAQDALKRLPNG